jgi:hypothetical protein
LFFEINLWDNCVSLNLIWSLLRLYFSSSVQFDTYKHAGLIFVSEIRRLTGDGQGEEDAERARVLSLSWWCRGASLLISSAFNKTSKKNRIQD